MTSRQEFGILFGFVAVFIVVIGTYSLMWHLKNKREEVKEVKRKQALIDRGL